MTIRKHGRNVVATTTLATTALLGAGVAPYALAQETTAPTVFEQLKVCADSTNFAVALDLGATPANLEIQKTAIVDLIESLAKGNSATFTLIGSDGQSVEKNTFDLPADKEKALDFVRALEPIDATEESSWDNILTATHGIEGLDAVAVFSDKNIDNAFDAPASVLKNKGVAVVPVSIGVDAGDDVVEKEKPVVETTAQATESKKESTNSSTSSSQATSTTSAQEETTKPTTSKAKPSKAPSNSSTTANESATSSADKPSSAQNPTTSAPKNTSPATSAPSATSAPLPATSAPATSAPAPSAGDGLLGDVIDAGKDIVGGLIGSGGGGSIIDAGKDIVGGLMGGGGAGDIISKGSEIVGGLLSGGGSGAKGIIDAGMVLLPISATTSALAGTTDQEIVLEYAKDTGLVDAEGNWDADAINTQLVEKGLADKVGIVNPVAVANALDAPQIVAEDGSFDAAGLASFFSTKDLSILLGAGETSSLNLVSASVAVPGIVEEDGIAVLPQALASTDVASVVNSDKGDEGLKDIVLLAAADTVAEEQGTDLVDDGVVETSEVVGNDVADTVRPDATGLVRVSDSEEAFEAIGAAFADACDIEIGESDKKESVSEDSGERPELASTGVNVAGLIGVGAALLLGAGLVFFRREN